MSAHGQLTARMGKFIGGEVKERGYAVYYDHGKKGEAGVGVIAVSLGEKLEREEELSQLDIAVVEGRKAICLVEIEEKADAPKKVIGDIHAVLMGNSVHLPGGMRAEVGRWTTLVVACKDAGHRDRNVQIAKTAEILKPNYGSENAKIGNIVIVAFVDGDGLKRKLMEQVEAAVGSYARGGKDDVSAPE